MTWRPYNATFWNHHSFRAWLASLPPDVPNFTRSPLVCPLRAYLDARVRSAEPLAVGYSELRIGTTVYAQPRWAEAFAIDVDLAVMVKSDPADGWNWTAEWQKLTPAQCIAVLDKAMVKLGEAA